MAKRLGTKRMAETLVHLRQYLNARHNALVDEHYQEKDMAPDNWQYPKGDEELGKWRGKQEEALEWLRANFGDLALTLKTLPERVKRMFIARRQTFKAFAWAMGGGYEANSLTGLLDRTEDALFEAGLLTAQPPPDFVGGDSCYELPEVEEAHEGVSRQHERTHFKNEEGFGEGDEERNREIQEFVDSLSISERLELEDILNETDRKKEAAKRSERLEKILKET